MSESEWKIAKPTGACCLCAAAIVPEQSYYSALFQAPESAPAAPAAESAEGASAAAEPAAGTPAAEEKARASLLRRDYCVSCFTAQKPADCYYFWKTQMPGPDDSARKAWKQRQAFDIDAVFEFFKRLEGDTHPQRVAFRYILALMLSRKKVLLAEGRTQDAAGGSAQIFAEKRGGTKHTVTEPLLDESEIDSVTAELGVLLGIAPPADTAAAAPGASAPESAADPAAADTAAASPTTLGAAQ